MSEKPATLWVRFEGYVRFHAVFLAAHGGYWTFCGRFHRGEGVTHETHFPTAQCNCCRSRLKHPFNVPDKLLALKAAFQPSVPV